MVRHVLVVRSRCLVAGSTGTTVSLSPTTAAPLPVLRARRAERLLGADQSLDGYVHGHQSVLRRHLLGIDVRSGTPKSIPQRVQQSSFLTPRQTAR